MEMKYSKTSLFAVFISENFPREAEHPQLTRRRLGHVGEFLCTDEQDWSR